MEDNKDAEPDNCSCDDLRRPHPYSDHLPANTAPEGVCPKCNLVLPDLDKDGFYVGPHHEPEFPCTPTDIPDEARLTLPEIRVAIDNMSIIDRWERSVLRSEFQRLAHAAEDKAYQAGRDSRAMDFREWRGALVSARGERDKLQQELATAKEEHRSNLEEDSAIKIALLEERDAAKAQLARLVEALSASDGQRAVTDQLRHCTAALGANLSSIAIRS